MPISTTEAVPAFDSATQTPELARIRALVPLRHLSDEEFSAVARHATSDRRPAGKPLFRAGLDDQWIFYLLDGEIEITDESGASFRLQGGTVETAHPLSPHAKARVLATVVREASYVRLPAQLLQIESAQRQRQGIDVEELREDADDVDKRVLFAVYHDLMDGSFTLPTLPDVALRIREAAADAGKGINEIVRIVQTDASIAAYCIKAANSAAYRTSTPVAGVHEAVLRLGTDATRDMIMAYALRDLCAALDAATRARLREAWQHGARIATLCYVIARQTGRVNPEQALLGGLVHDLGMLVLMREWNAYSDAPLDAATLRGLAHDLSGPIGSMVLRAWRFPDSIVAGALEPEQWQRSAGTDIDLCDCIALAHAHDRSPPPWSNPPPAIEQIAAYRKLPDGTLSASRRLRMIEEAEQELQAINRMLGA